MTLWLRPVFTLICAAILAISSLSLTTARGAPTQAGFMVICTGTGLVSIAVDTGGQPVGPVHICPDCVTTMIAALPDPASVAPDPVQIAADVVTIPVKIAPQFSYLAVRARGPPFLI